MGTLDVVVIATACLVSILVIRFSPTWQKVQKYEALLVSLALLSGAYLALALTLYVGSALKNGLTREAARIIVDLMGVIDICLMFATGTLLLGYKLDKSLAYRLEEMGLGFAKISRTLFISLLVFLILLIVISSPYLLGSIQ